MDTTARLGLPYLLPNQAQKHVTLNDSLSHLDALTGLLIRSRQISAEPISPSSGDAYLLPEESTGANWTSLPAGALVCFQEGAWRVLPIPIGLRAWVADEATLVVMSSEGWVTAAPARLSRLGIETDADPTNRLAVKSDSVLFSHDDVTPGTGDMRQIINRLDADNFASIIFQTDHVGGGEIGLSGDAGFDLRTSPDGADFQTGLRLRTSDGKASFPAGFSDPLTLLGQLKLRYSAATIADDTVATIDFGEPVYGSTILAVPNSLTSGAAVFFFARMAPTPSLSPLFSGGHAFTHSTGELTGTTGTDGGINFSATSDGRFLIENRRGYAVTYTVYAFK